MYEGNSASWQRSALSECFSSLILNQEVRLGCPYVVF